MATRSVRTLMICALLAVPAAAAVTDITATDVTTRAFSVVWVADEPLSAATVRVFDDAAGTTELTGGLGVSLSSGATSLSLGIVKVDVTGLAANTCVYFQTESTGLSVVQSPAAPPYTQVCTAVATRKGTAGEALIVNDLIRDNLLQPDGATAADGALMLLSLPDVGEYPISSFAGERLPLPAAMVDLSNIFDASTGASAEPAEDDVILIRQFRGLLCPQIDEQQLVRYRRVPPHDEAPTLGAPITELETGAPCFFADTECDDTIDILDAQRVLTAFGSQPGECRFNADLDIVADQVINVLDVQSVLNRFGETAPFN